MGVIKVVKKIDSKNRVVVPSEWGKSGDLVCYEITRGGNLLIKKVSNDETNKEVSLNDND